MNLELLWKIAILLFALIALLLNHKRRSKKKAWIATEGKVVGPRTMGDSSQVNISYLDHSGRSRLAQLPQEYGHAYDTPSNERIPFKTHQVLPILYNPHNPKDIDLQPTSKFAEKSRYIYLFLIALMLLLILQSALTTG